MMDWAGPLNPVPVDFLDREEGVIPLMAMADGSVLKVSPVPLNAFVSCFSVRLRKLNYADHLFQVYYAAGLPSHSMKSLGK